MKFWFDTLRSRLLLTLVTYALYLLLYIATDSVARDYYLGGGYPAWGYVIDIVTTSS
ncbi:unknown [Prevotella sp. CAG:1124]|nr:unknown [Prevotella sp. CAG:1124]